MKKLLTIFAIALTMVSTSIDADAAMRFGGGRSFGRSTPSLFQKAPAAKPSMAQKSATRQNAANKGAAASAATKQSPARGLLMGAAAALGITALASALGLSEELTHLLMVMLVAFAFYYALRFLFGLLAFSRPKASRGGANYEQESNSLFEARGASATPSRPGSVFDAFSTQAKLDDPIMVPAGFDVKGFEKVARENFVRLQKAWDSGDVNAISDFLTDDMFIAITHQLRERGGASQQSEVVDLTVKLLGVVEEEHEHIAIVAFTGAMRINGAFEEVREHWILSHAKDNRTGWLLAGIEQVQ